MGQRDTLNILFDFLHWILHAAINFIVTISTCIIDYNIIYGTKQYLWICEFAFEVSTKYWRVVSTGFWHRRYRRMPTIQSFVINLLTFYNSPHSLSNKNGIGME